MKKYALFFVFLILTCVFASQFSCSENLSAIEYPLFVCSPNNFSSTLHLASNAFYILNAHPIALLLSHLFTSSSYLIFLVLWFIGGAWLYERSFAQALSALIVSVALYALFGADAVIFHAIVWIPWLLWGLRLVREENRSGMLVLFAISILHALTALQTSLLGAIFAVLVFSEINKDPIRKKEIAWAIIFLPTLAALFFSLTPYFPSYPAFSRIFPTIYPHREPWFGDSPAVWLLNVENLSHIFLIPSMIGLSLSVFLLFKKERTFIRYLTAAIFLSLFIDCFSVFPDSGSEIGPIATLTRILPGFSFLPVNHLFLCFGVLLLMAQLGEFLPVFLSFVMAIISLVLHHPLLSMPISSSFQQNEQISKVLRSPSGIILRSHPSLVNDLIHETYKSKIWSRPLNRFPNTIKASHSPETISRIHIGQPSKRWTPSKGKQEGDEYILIRFEKPTHMRGVQISPGAFHGDYMRGVRIRALQNCASIDESLKGTIIAENNRFEGEIGWTPEGYPFYESPSEGRIHFKIPQSIQCLAIEQIGIAEQFDWSVSSIRILQ